MRPAIPRPARISASLLALLIALFAAVPGGAAAASEPKVVLIVGPVGEATARYREQAEDAARVAERYTSNVVRVYSPNATWPAVTQALDGAAVVVYLGHGNGWPSKYRDTPFGGTQNGFGLNPVAGVDDESHQYFGEDRISAEVSLARNAVVLLHHLCYASGNTEPGLPEGTIEQGRQRVDNYAAGFIRAGASAVVAEGHMGPAWYMERLFKGTRSIDRVWLDSPNANGHEFSFDSSRSPGFVAAMDPDTADSGFYRSIVYRGRAGAGRLTATPGVALPAPSTPTLVGTGLTFEAPYVKGRPIAGAATELWFPYVTEDAGAIKGLGMGVRWDPIDVAGSPAPEPAATTEEENPGAEPAEGPPDPSTGDVTYIEPERLGDVVQPVAAAVGPKRIRAAVKLPALPGRYRLVVTLHDGSGVAYDAPSQTLVPGVIVHVSGENGARYLVAPTVTAKAGEPFGLPIGVANVGAQAWGQEGSGDWRNLEERPIAATVTAHWVALAAEPGPGASAASVSARLGAGLPAGGLERLALGLTAPETPGSYLVVIDVRVPGVGSLTAIGSPPAIVRVTVE